MNHWLLDAIAERRDLALREANRVLCHREMRGEVPSFDEELLRDMANALEIAVLDLTMDRLSDDDERCELLRQAAADAFQMMRMLPLPTEPMAARTHLLRASVLAMLGDCGADAAQWRRALDETRCLPTLSVDALNWGERCRATITDIWLRLACKSGQSDLDVVLERVDMLRSAQEEFEQGYLRAFTPLEAKRSALELIAIYHLAKAAEMMAQYFTDGMADGRDHVKIVIDHHFDCAIDACEDARGVSSSSRSATMASICLLSSACLATMPAISALSALMSTASPVVGLFDVRRHR